MTYTKPTKGDASKPVLDLKEHMVVTEDELDVIYGTDGPMPPPVTSTVDTVRDELREEGYFPDRDAPVEVDPVLPALLEPDDFEHVNFDGSSLHHDQKETPQEKTLDPCPSSTVIRPASSSVSSRTIFMMLGLLMVLGVWAFIWFNPDPRTDHKAPLASLNSLFTEFLGAHPQVGEGLVHQNITPRREMRNGVQYLIVEGDVQNITDKPITLPMLKFVLNDATGKELVSKTTGLKIAVLEPHETVRFAIEFPNPPGLERTMELRFEDWPDQANSSN